MILLLLLENFIVKCNVEMMAPSSLRNGCPMSMLYEVFDHDEL